MIVCCFCHGPLAEMSKPGIDYGKRRYNHIAASAKGHNPDPGPEGKGGQVVHVRFEAARIAIWEDAKKNIQRNFWIGPYNVQSYGDAFSIDLTCLAENVGEVTKKGYESGLGVFGKYQRMASKPEKHEMTPEERVENGLPARKTRRASTPESQEVQTWWRCPSCKRHIKKGAEFHYQSASGAKCVRVPA